MPVYIDMMGFPVEIKSTPQRIISLVPSLTQLLVDIGVTECLVGVTKFCVHPKELRETKTVIGGTKMIHMDRIDQLDPDLIIANKEENNKEDVEYLQEKYPVWISDISNADEAIDAIRMLAHIVSAESAGSKLLEQINKERTRYRSAHGNASESVAYVIWKSPWMAAGTGTFIDDMIREAGFCNVFENQARYPVFDLGALKTMKPDRIFLSSEPFPFKASHKSLLTDVVTEDKIHLVDGEMFSWYGSRMADAYAYFEKLRTAFRMPAS